MLLARIVLILSGLLFTGLGFLYMVWPDQMAAKTDLRIESAMARTEVRATYGGMEIAMGLLLVYTALSHSLVLPGMWLTAALFAGFAGGRAIGLVAEGVSQPFSIKLLLIELTGFGLTSVLAAWMHLHRT